MGFQVHDDGRQPAQLDSTQARPGWQDRAGRSRRRFVELAHTAVMARIILAVAFSMTVLAWWFSHAAVEESTEERFQFRSNEIETAILERLDGYETVLWSGVGLFDATGGATREQFADYVAALDLNERWPGIQGVGWAVPLEPGQIADHEAEVQAEGFADYAVVPEGRREQYSSIVYLEPFDWRNQRAFGFDMWSNPERREAMGRARDTGQAATTAMITLVQETEDDVQRGFLTYVPVYAGAETPATVEGRRDAHLGWVYAPFRMDDLMSGILGSSSDQVEFRIFDGQAVDPKTLLFDSNSSSTDAGSDLTRRETVLVQGHPWTMVFRTGEGFSLGSDTLPTYVAVAGLLIEVLLFYVISTLGALNQRAESIAETKTVELRRTNEELHRRSEELEYQTAQLTRRNDELRQFAHVASHDLQEPLRTMASYSSLVSNSYADGLGDEGQRWLGYINSSAKRLSELIREILQFSTFEHLNSPAIGVDLNQIMDGVQEDLVGMLAEASVEVEVEELPVVAGDPVQLRRLLTNLVHNAATYRRAHGTPRVTVQSAPQDAMHRISVRDNGIGIEPEFQQRIFELFRRAAPRTEETGMGTGLAICRKIVHAHGGEIGVVSSVGHGTEFWFELEANVEGRVHGASDSRADSDVDGGVVSGVDGGAEDGVRCRRCAPEWSGAPTTEQTSAAVTQPGPEPAHDHPPSPREFA